MRKKKADEDLTKLVQRYFRSKANAKKLYDRADRTLMEIASQVTPGEEISLNGNGKKAILVDNFAGKSVVWGHGGVRHYDIDLIDV